MLKNICVGTTSFTGLFTRLDPKSKLPTMGTLHAGAFDLYSLNGGVLRPSDEEAVEFRTGVGLILPQGYHVQFWPRSSKGRQRILIHGGFIDYDFRRELVVLLSVVGPKQIMIPRGEKIAQMAFVACLIPGVPDLDRGPGFGSTDDVDRPTDTVSSEEAV